MPAGGRVLAGLGCAGVIVADGALFAACGGSKEDDTALYRLEPA